MFLRYPEGDVEDAIGYIDLELGDEGWVGLEIHTPVHLHIGCK